MIQVKKTQIINQPIDKIWNILYTDDSCDGNEEAVHAIFLATVAYIEATGRFD